MEPLFFRAPPLGTNAVSSFNSSLHSFVGWLDLNVPSTHEQCMGCLATHFNLTPCFYVDSEDATRTMLLHVICTPSLNALLINILSRTDGMDLQTMDGHRLLEITS